MKRSLFSCLTAVLLALVLLAAPPAQALTVEQCADLLQTLYVDEVPQSVLEQPTIDGMLDALGDPYTEYFTAEEYGAFTASMSDTSLVGIGVAFTVTDEGLLVDQVLDGSPALAGGLEAGDLVVAVDGVSILGEAFDAVTALIRGEEGTTVRVTYLRSGNEKTVTLTRALLVIPATTSQLIDGHIGYIRCTTFGAETVGHFREGIEACRDEATVWIVDLRSNLGGSTDAATRAAGLFAGPGDMAYLRDGAGEYGVYRQEESALSLQPVIVLVDYYSASASEIFASAIRDSGAGIVVGTRTFGKGVAQTVLDQTYMPDYFSNGDAIKITSHRFFSPAGNTTDQVGVIPDLLVDPEDTADVAYLLCGSDPLADTGGTLRVDIDWRWYIDLDLATGEYAGAFEVLLNALPDNKKLWRGVEGTQGWEPVEAGEIAARYALDYRAPFFPDRDDSDYDTPISVLKTYDLIHGYEDGLFHPRNTLTRAELCQLLAVALNCELPTQKSPYSDVRDDAWYTPAILAMTNMGLVQGVGDGLFLPEETIDHQQFITILGRLGRRLNMFLYNTAAEMPEGSTNVVGLMDYADWARPSAWLLSYSQKGLLGNTVTLLWNSADKIVPTEETTRDEAAYALYQLLSHIEILPA